MGFSIKDYEPMDEKNPYGAWDIKKAELHETSVVSVPANPSAVLLAKSLGIRDSTREMIFGAGKTATLSSPQSRAKSAPVTKSDYSEMLGDPSDVVRRREQLRSQGLIP